MHQQLYPHHIPGSEGAQGLRVLSPPCHSPKRASAPAGQTEGLQPLPKHLVSPCFGASANHQAWQGTFPEFKGVPDLLLPQQKVGFLLFFFFTALPKTDLLIGGLGQLPCKDRLRKLGLSSLEKGRLCAWLPQSNIPLSEGALRKLKRDSASGTAVRGQGIMGSH